MTNTDVLPVPVRLFRSIWRFLTGVWDREPWMNELGSAVVGICWGLVFCFSDFRIADNITYHSLASLTCDPLFWGGYCFVAGAFQIWALAVNWRQARLAAAAIASTFPSLVVYSFIYNSPLTPGTIAFAGFASMNLYSVARHARRFA